MAITPLPVPVPQRSDPANFPARGDAFLTALPTFGTEANALAVDVNNKQLLAAASQAAALTSENSAAASAAASAASAAASVWVSGTTYAVGDARYSPTTFLTYRRKTAGAGTTDPATDITNWQQITGGPYPYLHIREEQASNTGGGNSLLSAVQTRVLNTVKGNTIIGASLASNTITLPAGTYEFRISVPAYQVDQHRAYLTNVTDTLYYLGTSEFANSSTAVLSWSVITGRLTIAATKTFHVDHYTNIATTSGFGLGKPVGITGGGPTTTEVYTSAEFWKIA